MKIKHEEFGERSIKYIRKKTQNHKKIKKKSLPLSTNRNSFEFEEQENKETKKKH